MIKIKELVKRYKKYVLILFFCILIEIIVFNYNSITTINLDKKIIKSTEFNIKGMVKEENHYRIVDDVAYIEINNINKNVKSLYLNTSNNNYAESKFKLYYTDESTSLYDTNYRLNRRDITVLNSYERSKYIPCNFIGNTQNIKLEFDSSKGGYVYIENIIINEHIPFSMINSIIRIALGYLIIIGLYNLINNPILKGKFKEDNKAMNAKIIGIVSISFIAIMFSLIMLSGTLKYQHIIDGDYYATSFIESLAKGRVNLPQEPPEELVNLENPYDYSQRKDIDCLWDVVYYKGYYYLYFGILPALLVFLPMKLLFNLQLTSTWVLFIFNIFSIFMTCKFLLEVIKKWFSSTKYNMICILMIFFLFSNKILWITARPEFYEMVISVAYFFVMTGMYYAFKSNLFNTENKLNYKQLCISCICLALAVACRPTTLLVSILILPNLIKLFINSIKQFKINKNEIFKFMVYCALPYIIVGSCLMFYNYIRFENPFEFGSSYQLTVTDNRNMHFSLSRSAIGLYSYLFSFPNITPDFPFVVSNDTLPFYQGIYYNSSVGGGIFAVGILPFVLLLLPFLYKNIKEKNKQLLYFVLLSIAIGILIIVIAASMAGNIGRYMVDCAWLFNLTTILIILFIYEKLCNNDFSESIITRIILFCVVTCSIINFLLAITGENNLIYELNIQNFYKLKYLFSFWI